MHENTPTPLNSTRKSVEELLANALKSATDLRSELVTRGPVLLNNPEVEAAIRYAAAGGFSVRELTRWFRDLGIPVNSTGIFRKTQSVVSKAENEYFVEGFQRLEEAIRWVMSQCGSDLPRDTSFVFVYGILGQPWHEEMELIKDAQLASISTEGVRGAIKGAIDTFLDGLKAEKCLLLPQDVRHLELFRYLASQAHELEIKKLIEVAKQIHRRPEASQRLVDARSQFPVNGARS